MIDMARFRLRSVEATTRPETSPACDALVRAGRGDQAAFADVYDLTSASAYGIVLHIVRDPSIAEEITQEVYVEVWRLAPRFSPDKGTAKAWINTLAHRRAVDRVRSEQARRNREERDAQREAATTVPSTAEVVEDELDAEQVRAALEGLTDAQREAVSLAYYDGYTYREVAALLDVAEGTIKTRIRDGLKRLRTNLGDPHDE